MEDNLIVAERLGRKLSGDRGELVFLVSGTESPAAARTAMLASSDAPATLAGLERDAEGSDVEELEGGKFVGRVRYRTPGQPRPPQFSVNESVYNFEISGVQTRVLQSKQTVGSYGSSPPDFGGAINVQDGRVEGADVVVPEATFSETHFIANGSMTTAYQNTIRSLTGRVNSGAFKGYAAGEVLFQGASGSRRGRDDWEVTFRFAVSPNETNLNVGGITVSSKGGWHYLWAFYEATDETENETPVVTPTAAYVERVYDAGNFALLGIGT